ncbi:hypothetical protein BH18ACI3_BH18ACI3_21690 [soil metagenome]
MGNLKRLRPEQSFPLFLRQIEMRADIQNLSLINRFLRHLFTLFILLAASATLFGQDLPDKIQGYKVHRTIIVVDSEKDLTRTKQGEAFVTIGDPELVDVSLSGITLSVSAAITALNQSGKVDFLTFRDFRVNGIPVEIEKYDTPFSFSKNEPASLPKPASLFLPSLRLLNAAWNEITDTKKSLIVTGRVFVFGKFRKMGFSFKRVVPIDIKLTIKNPLLN